MYDFFIEFDNIRDYGLDTFIESEHWPIVETAFFHYMCKEETALKPPYRILTRVETPLKWHRMNVGKPIVLSALYVPQSIQMVKINGHSYLDTSLSDDLRLPKVELEKKSTSQWQMYYLQQQSLPKSEIPLSMLCTSCSNIHTAICPICRYRSDLELDTDDNIVSIDDVEYTKIDFEPEEIDPDRSTLVEFFMEPTSKELVPTTVYYEEFVW